MSCCPAAPAIRTGSDAAPLGGPENTIRPGETVECFSKRAGNSTGALDDATEDRKNTIDNDSIATTQSGTNATVDIQFTLTSNSTATGVTWSMTGDNISPVTMTSSGKLSGTFPASLVNKKVTITVKATWATPVEDSEGKMVTSDERTYSFSPSVAKDGEKFKLLFPMNGGGINSKFGMRFHPIQKVQKLHTGIDIVHSVKGVNHPILCAADGVVIKARNTDPNGYGNAIHVKHTNASGQHICTTTYNHLFKILVSEGDKVSAGQQIALEGGAKGVPGSGGSSGLHLHFECKLPDGSFTDPSPYFNGAVVPTSGSSPGTSQLGPVSAAKGGELSKAEADAKSDCPNSANYPADADAPEPAADTPPGGAGSAFELAWVFTMRYEVGPHWNVPAGQTPSDPEIVQGLCDTADQRKKCGYVVWGSAEGGETKFGIAGKANPRTNIKTMTYAQAKALGYSNYWVRGNVKPATLPPYLAMFMFDTNYQHGPGHGQTIYRDAGVSSGPWPDKASQMADLEKLYKRRLQFAKTLKNENIRKGVAARVEACYAYVKAATVTS